MEHLLPADRYCFGCFSVRAEGPRCPSCGYHHATLPAPLILQPGTILNERYIIGRVLGKPGGFGITYLALDSVLNKRVAIKEYLPRDQAARSSDHTSILPHTEDDAALFEYGKQQFLQEAVTIARFDHRNIVEVRDFFPANGTAYIVMRYYDGQTLRECLHKQGTLSEEAAIGYLIPVLEGLKEVHKAGILHRDIKPSNIYLAQMEGREPYPILLDFGAAREALGERSRSIDAVLTPGFAPPEQYQSSREHGVYTDIYACAATLYFCVTGQVPPPALERLYEDSLDLKPCTERLAAVLRQAMALRPEERPQTTTHFQDALLGKIEPRGGGGQGQGNGTGKKNGTATEGEAFPQRWRYAVMGGGGVVATVLLVLFATGFFARYTLDGHVKDANGIGIREATVLLYKADDANPRHQTTTDSTGAYRFDGLRRGEYSLSVLHDYVSPDGEGERVVLEGDNTLELTQAIQTFNITGRIIDPQGNGQRGIEVRLGGHQGQTTTTNSQGRFTFSGLHAGNVYTILPIITTSFYPTGLEQLERLGNHVSSLEWVVGAQKEAYTYFAARAYAQNQAGAFYEAIGYATRAIRINESDTLAYVLRSRAHYELGQYEAALADAEKGHETESNKAFLYSGAGQYDHAETLFRQRLQRDPTYADAHAGLAMNQERAGNRAEALNTFRRLIKIEPLYARGAQAVEDATSAYYNQDEGLILDRLAEALLPEGLALFNQITRQKAQDLGYRPTRVLLWEDFKDNSGGWEEKNEATGSFVQIGNDRLVMEQRADGYRITTWFPLRHKDILLRFDVTPVSGANNGGGVIFRRNSSTNRESFALLYALGDPGYNMGYLDPQWHYLQSWTKSSLIQARQPNQVELIVVGNQMHLYVNGHFIQSVSGVPDLTGAYVGFLIANSGVRYAFDNLCVIELEKP